jgi:hypothetical protein
MAAAKSRGAPARTIGFHGASIFSDPATPRRGRPVRIYLDAENGGLTLAPGVTGQVRLSVATPPGVAAPQGFPRSVSLTNSQGEFTVTFRRHGYNRITATGPGHIVGWVTIDVGVRADSAPSQ